MAARLEDDHASAKRLARGLNALQASFVDPDEVETNIVKVQVPPDGPPAAVWSQQLEDEGVRVSPCESYALRFVTHRHIGDTQIDATVRAFASVFQRLRAE